MVTTPTAAPRRRPPTLGSERRGRLDSARPLMLSIVLLLELLAVSYMMNLDGPAGHLHALQTTQGAWLLTAFLLVGAMAAPLTASSPTCTASARCCWPASVSHRRLVLSASRSSYAMMIAGRCLAGLMVPTLFLSYSLIRDVSEEDRCARRQHRDQRHGLIAIAAPFLTGWLLDGYGFRSIFWFVVICLAVLGGLIQLTTPESNVRLRSRSTSSARSCSAAASRALSSR